MAKEQTQEKLIDLGYDWRLLQGVKIADGYLKQGKAGVPYAQKSLEMILAQTGTSDPLVKKLLLEPENLQKMTKSYGDTYNQYFGEQTIGDLLEPYRNDIKKYFGDLEDELFTFSDKKYSGILKEIDDAKYVLEGKDRNVWSKEQLEEADKTIKKYEPLLAAVELLYDQPLSEFRSELEKNMKEEGFSNCKEALEKSRYPVQEEKEAA
jgi:hypothetical protein